MSRSLALRTAAVVLAACVAGCAGVTGTPASRLAPCTQDSTIPKVEPGGPITAPRILHREEPRPSTEVLRRKPLVAAVEAVIDANGEVGQVCYESGDPQWAEHLAEAVRQWRFAPATLDGKPVAVWFTLTSSLR